jgi:hypothetical protein
LTPSPHRGRTTNSGWHSLAKLTSHHMPNRKELKKKKNGEDQTAPHG